MTKNNKTNLKEDALKILKDAFELVIKEEKDYESDKATDDALIEEIFDCAWNNQFSSNPSKFKREIRTIIINAVGTDDEN